jgi:glutamate-1-semialdehyde 2,1-aminomutase
MDNNILNYDMQNNNIIISHAKDIYLYDTNDNKYIDTRFGSGTLILGHADEELIEYIKNNLNKGTIYSMLSKPTLEYSIILKKILNWYSKFILCSTGSEAVMRAFRIARSYSKKNKIVMFTGFWHGSYDNVLFDNSKIDISLKSSGILDDLKNNAVIVENDDSCFEIIEKNKNDIAMIFIEPLQHLLPKDNKKLLLKLREYCTKNKIILCFDEIVTGFRLSVGGAQKYFDIYSDMACYGKISGGGFPIGIVGVNKDIEEHIQNVNPKIFLGGTFSGNPITSLAGKFVLNKLYDSKNKYIEINNLTEKLCNEVNNFCEQENIPVRLYFFGSIYRFIFTDKKIYLLKERKLELSNELQNIFFSILKENKVIVGYNPSCFMSLKNSETDVVLLIEKIKVSLNTLKTNYLIIKNN